MPLLFTVTLFLSAALLFMVQPLVARLLLPLLGGSPGVWNTCMVFFQALLLAGYAVAHWLPAWLGLRAHAMLHLALLLLGLLFLPIQLPANVSPPVSAFPAFWQLGLLVVLVGLPFFVLSANGPLLQRWFAATGRPDARDPYFLYAASNVGSMLALIAYPLLLEPLARLPQQAAIWTGGYAALVLLTAVCAGVLWRTSSVNRALPTAPPPLEPAQPASTKTAIRKGRAPAKPARGAKDTIRSPWWRYTRWTLLAFVPSSLMLSVTTYLTTDLAAIPLLWVIPLAIYLLTFILVFARRQLLPHTVVVSIMPLLIVLLVIAILSEARDPLPLLLSVHVVALFVVGMVCHGELARDRPPGEQLTVFYLCLSLGGVLGGVFTGLLAPLVFKWLTEYPLTIILASLLRPSFAKEASAKLPAWTLSVFGRALRITRSDILLPIVLGGLTVILAMGTRVAGMAPGPMLVGMAIAVPALICYFFVERPLRFGLGVAAVFLGGTLIQGANGRVVLRERDYYGVHRVTLDAEGKYLQLLHGNTIHGRQSLDPERANEPLVYYNDRSPIANLFRFVRSNRPESRIAVVGLGAGSLSSSMLVKQGQELTFYEIDPAVIRIAKEHFTFLKRCEATLRIVEGDARLTLANAEERASDLLVIDAFSSDAIPVHLLTKQALALYRSKLRPAGLIVFHTSNRYLRLERVLSALARDAGLALRFADQGSVGESDIKSGWTPSQWVVLAEDEERLARLTPPALWQRVPQSDLRPWTDDYSNLVGALKWLP